MKYALLKRMTWNQKLLKFPGTYFHFTVFSTRNTLFHSLGFLGAAVTAKITFLVFLKVVQINFLHERDLDVSSLFLSIILCSTH